MRAGSGLKNMERSFNAIPSKALTHNKGSKVFVVLAIFIFFGTSSWDQIIHSFFPSLIQSHIHSFNNQNNFLNAHVVLRTMLGVGKKNMNRAQPLPLR